MMSVRRILAVGAFMALAFASIAAFGYAQMNGGTVIHACYNNTNGAMRYVDPSNPDGTACRENETALEWNVEGIQGPQGPPGSPGGIVDAYYADNSVHTEIQANPTWTTVLSLEVPAGAWVVNASVHVYTWTRVPVICAINGGEGSYGQTFGVILETFPDSNSSVLPLQGVLSDRSFARTIEVQCMAQGAPDEKAWAAGRQMTATRVQNLYVDSN